MNGYANSNDSEPSMTPREYMTGLKKQFDYTFAMMEVRAVTGGGGRRRAGEARGWRVTSAYVLRQYLFEQKEHLTREYDNSQLDLVNANEQNRDLRKQVGELKAMVEERERELVSCACWPSSL